MQPTLPATNRIAADPTTTRPTVTGSVRVETRDPKDLRTLAAVKDLDAWPDDDPRFLEFCEDVKAKGIITELLITDSNEIIDGRHRWRAAIRWQFTSVPVRVVSGKQQDELILMQLSTLAHRRHYTPGQRAFIMYPFVKAAHEAILKQHETNLRKGRAETISAWSGNGGKKGWQKTTSDLAEELNLSRDTFDLAAWIHRQFEEHDLYINWNEETLEKLHLSRKGKYTIAQIFTPQILDEQNPMGLGHAKAGIGFVLQQVKKGEHGGGRPKSEEKQLELFKRAFRDMSTRYEYWTNFDGEAKAEARTQIRTSFEKMPDDLLRALSSEVRAELQRRRAEGTEN